MSQKFRLIDADKAYDQLRVEIERREFRLKVLNQVLDSLRGMEGKPLTWHLAKKLTSYHPSQKFSFDNSAAWFNLTITGEGMDSLNLNLGYKGQVDGVSIKDILNHNQAYLLDEGRIPKMKDELKTVEARVKRYNEALIEANRAHAELGEGRYSFTNNTSLSLEDTNGRWYTDK